MVLPRRLSGRRYESQSCSLAAAVLHQTSTAETLRKRRPPTEVTCLRVSPDTAIHHGLSKKPTNQRPTYRVRMSRCRPRGRRAARPAWWVVPDTARPRPATLGSSQTFRMRSSLRLDIRDAKPDGSETENRIANFFKPPLPLLPPTPPHSTPLHSTDTTPPLTPPPTSAPGWDLVLVDRAPFL